MFVRSIHLVSAVVSAWLLASCATMSPEECKRADWGAVGQADGLDGQPLSYLDDRAPDGHPKLLHLWPPKVPQAGRTDYGVWGRRW